MAEETEYFSKDFEWEQLRNQVESNPSFAHHLQPHPSSSSPPHDSDSDAWKSFHNRHSTGKFFKPLAGPPGDAKADAPTERTQSPRAFVNHNDDLIPIRNRDYELSLVAEGHFGHFLDRSSTNPHPVHIPIYPTAYWQGVFFTLRDVLKNYAGMKEYVKYQDVETRSNETASILADGIVVMTYLKLRSVNFFDVDEMNKFLTKPKVPMPFEPSPYALAISQLGIFKVSSLEKELVLVPTLPVDVTTNHGLTANKIWSPSNYVQAMEFAKSLGMQFSTVDLKVKLGSSWWLYDQELKEEIFTLNCILPEDNYTETSALVHTLFCANDRGTPFNVIFDLSKLDQTIYGSMLRNPHADINVRTYFAITETVETI